MPPPSDQKKNTSQKSISQTSKIDQPINLFK